MLVMDVQEKMIDDIIHIKESDPPTNVTLSFTVPIVTCPPSDKSLALSSIFDNDLSSGATGIHLSPGSPDFAGGSGDIRMSAVDTSNSNSRGTGVETYCATCGGLNMLDRYSAGNSRGSPLDGYTAFCKVRSRLKTKRKISLLLIILINNIGLESYDLETRSQVSIALESSL